MRQILAFPLRDDDEQTVALPVSANVLTVRMQGDTPTLFCVANPENLREPVTIIMRFTEDRESLPEFVMLYLGTVQEQTGAPVRHVFMQANDIVDADRYV